MTPEKEPVRVYLILGSNMGDRRRNLSIAVSLLVTELAPWLFSDVRESDVLETEPWGMPEGTEPFMNQAISFETTVDHCPARGSAESLQMGGAQAGPP